MDNDILKILVSIFLLVLFILTGNLTRIVMRRFLEERTSVRNAKIIARLSEYLVFSAGLYIIYSEIGLDLKAYAASLGILSIAVAFSSQQIIQNLVAGIIIALERPIQLEDWVDIGAGINQTGMSRVRDINLMRTVLRDREGRLIYLPNSFLMTSRIFNYTRSGFTEIAVNVKASPNSDLAQIRSLLIAAADEDPAVLPNVAPQEKPTVLNTMRLPGIQKLFENRLDLSMFEPRTLITEMSDMGTTISLRIWVREAHKRDEIVSRILESFQAKMREKGLSLKN